MIRGATDRDIKIRIPSHTYMTRSKPEKIPAGDEYLPDVPEAELESMIAAIPNCNKIPKKLLTSGQ